eukprot:scaffold126648_cov31-Tisochrysis_lutea.AAC.2
MSCSTSATSRSLCASSQCTIASRCASARARTSSEKALLTRAAVAAAVASEGAQARSAQPYRRKR